MRALCSQCQEFMDSYKAIECCAKGSTLRTSSNPSYLWRDYLQIPSPEGWGFNINWKITIQLSLFPLWAQEWSFVWVVSDKVLTSSFGPCTFCVLIISCSNLLKWLYPQSTLWSPWGLWDYFVMLHLVPWLADRKDSITIHSLNKTKILEWTPAPKKTLKYDLGS